MGSAADWSERVLDAAGHVAQGGGGEPFAGSVGEWVGGLLVLMGRAAGHADRMTGSGPVAEKARRHFRSEMEQVGARALGLLQESRRRQGQPPRTDEEVTEGVARRRVLANRAPGAQEPTAAPAGHAAAGLGAGIAALGTAVRTIPLDDEHLVQLDSTLESVLAHAIAAVARS
jgi:hypothetical protein